MLQLVHFTFLITKPLIEMPPFAKRDESSDLYMFFNSFC